MKEKNIHSIVRAILGAVIFVLVIYNISELKQICVIDDEFGYWGTSAYLSGYDWTGLSGTSPYYGYGMSFIHMWLFKMFDNSVTMYRAAIVLNGIMLVISYYISTTCCKKIFPQMPDFYITVFSFFITLYPNTLVQSQIAWTETLLYLWFWVCFYFALKILEKPSHILMITWGIVLIYGMMIHQRTLGVICAGVLYIVLLILCKRLKVKYAISFFIPLICMSGLFVGIKGYLNENFWKTFTPEIAAINDFEGQLGKVRAILSIDGIKDFICSIIGKAYYLIFSTMFIVLAYVFLSGKQIFLVGTDVVKRKFAWANVVYSNMFLFCAFIASFLISAIFMYRFTDRGDVFLYGRYVEFVIGPILMFGLGEIYYCKNKWSMFGWIAGISVCISKIVNNIWVQYDITSFHVTNCVGVGRYFSEISKYDTAIYSILVKFLLIAFIAVLLIGNRYSGKILYVVALALILYNVWMPEVNYNSSNTYSMQEHFSENVIDIVHTLQEVEEKKVYYVVDDRDGVAYNTDVFERNIKYIQFYLYDRTIEILNYTSIDKQDGYYIVRKASPCYESVCGKAKIIDENHFYGVFQINN